MYSNVRTVGSPTAWERERIRGGELELEATVDLPRQRNKGRT